MDFVGVELEKPEGRVRAWFTCVSWYREHATAFHETLERSPEMQAAVPAVPSLWACYSASYLI